MSGIKPYCMFYTYFSKYVKENGGLDFAAEKYSGCAVLNGPENGYPIVQQGKLVPQFSENCFCDKLQGQNLSLSRPICPVNITKQHGLRHQLPDPKRI